MTVQKITTYPGLTPEAIDKARALIGVPLRRRPHYRQVSKDLLVRWAKGLGSRNPLYADLSHGTLSTSWASLLGHPTVLMGFDHTIVAPKLPGVHTILGGATWTWHKQVRPGQRIDAAAWLTGVEEKEGEFCGPMVLQTSQVEYRNERGELLAEVTPRVLRTPRDAARERGKYRDISRHEYSQQEFEEIISAYQAESFTGTKTIYTEDVQVGDVLPRIVKGPLTTEDMNFFLSEIAETLFFREFLAHMRRHPADVYWHPDLNMPDSWDASFLLDAPAQAFGFPTAHDTGLQRIAWFDCLVTNWMGDLAMLRKLDVRLTRPFLHADTAWLSGEVSGLHWEGVTPRTELSLVCHNQRGEVVALATAEVELPSRSFDVPQPGLILAEGYQPGVVR